MHVHVLMMYFKLSYVFKNINIDRHLYNKEIQTMLSFHFIDI